MTKRKIISYFLIPILSVYLLICNLSIISFADVPSSQIVQSYSGTWDSYGLNITGLGKYYVIEDSIGLPTSNYNAPNFYYTKDNITFDYVRGINLVINQLNKIVGVILSPERITAFYTTFFNKIGILDANYHAQGGLYDGDNNFIGYCLNDITGCYYVHNTNNQDLTVPNYFPNNIKNVADDDFLDDLPPYVHCYPFNGINVLNNLYSGYNFGTTEREAFTSIVNSNDYVWMAYYDFRTNNRYFRLHNQDGSYKRVIYSNVDILTFYNTNSTQYSKFCQLNGMNVLNNTISIGEVATGNGNGYPLQYRPVDSNYDDINSYTQYNFSDNTANSSYTFDQFYFKFGCYGADYIGAPMGKDFIVYKDKSTMLQFADQTYQPSEYTTNVYKTYDINSDNSNTVTTYNIDNSVGYNYSIYEQSSENYYNYYDNGVIDNSSVVNNVTNITNHYYGDSNSGGSGGDNGGGSGDNDGVLDTLLEGLLAFFNAIGRVLATVITGLLDMFTTVLDAIASLTTDLTGVTDFFGSLFSWMPDPIPQVLGIGISVCILCAVIRFIRG